MNTSEIVTSIDNEIARLQSARNLLAPSSSNTSASTQDSNHGSPGKTYKSKAGRKPGKQRHMSDEGRERIRQAVKRRWAEAKKGSKKANAGQEAGR